MTICSRGKLLTAAVEQPMLSLQGGLSSLVAPTSDMSVHTYTGPCRLIKRENDAGNGNPP